MIYFGIPLRSRQASNNWDNVSRYFNRTLWSVYNQTDSEFQIIIACHEIPELTHAYDERVMFIKVDAPIPSNKDEMMLDKGYKVHTIAMRIRELGGGFTMMVDADDIQSNKIAAYVNTHPSANGFVAHSGYYYHEGDSFIKLGRKFPNGSSTIVKYTVEDLPSEHYPVVVTSNNTNPHIVRKKHGDIPKICAELGRPLTPLPFPASIYVRETGDNHSLMGKKESPWRMLEQKLTPRIYMNERLRKEFSIDWM